MSKIMDLRKCNTFILSEYSKEESDYYKTLIESEISNYLNKMIQEYSVPPIKGEITENKLRWRGIKKCQDLQYKDGLLYWVEQRGKVLGKKFLFD